METLSPIRWDDVGDKLIHISMILYQCWFGIYLGLLKLNNNVQQNVFIIDKNIHSYTNYSDDVARRQIAKCKFDISVKVWGYRYGFSVGILSIIFSIHLPTCL